VPRRQRGSKVRRTPLSTRRSGRVSGLHDHALGAASDDEDYCPPGIPSTRTQTPLESVLRSANMVTWVLAVGFETGLLGILCNVLYGVSRPLPN